MIYLRKHFTPFLILFVIFNSCNSAGDQQTDLSVAAFEKAITGNDIQLLDVRTAVEFQSGHLKNAILANWNDEPEFQEKVKALDKSKPVYTYCLGGARSEAATSWLRQAGYKAYNLSGGINAWKMEGKPIDQSKIAP